MRKPASKPSQPSSSPSGGPNDDDNRNGGDENGGDGNDNAGVAASTPWPSPPPDMSNPEGGTGSAIGRETPPPSGPKGIGQCALVPKKPTMEDEGKPAASLQWNGRRSS